MSDPNNGSGANGAVSIFAPIKHPILRSFDPAKVSYFIEERERCELEIEEKRNELPTLKAGPYTACIDRRLLNSMVFLEEFETIAPNKSAEQLSSDNVKTFK